MAAALPSAAERIAKLKASLEADEKRLEELNASLNAPESEYAKAEAEFRDLDSQRTAIQQKLSEHETTNNEEDLASVRTEAAALEKKWTLAKERFDLAIGERKAKQESVTTLQRKLESDRASLVKLQDAGEPLPLSPRPPDRRRRRRCAAGGQRAGTAFIAAAGRGNSAAGLGGIDTNTNSTKTFPGGDRCASTQRIRAPACRRASPILTEKMAKELAAASAVAQQRHAAAKAAEDEEHTITDRIEILAKDIALQRQLRDTARKTVDNSEKMLHGLNAELFSKMMAGENIDDIRKQIEEVTQRLHENRIKAQELSTQLDELQSQLTDLQADRLAAANELASKQAAADPRKPWWRS